MPHSRRHFTACGLVLFGFWTVLSGKFDALHLAMGMFSAVAVTFISGNLLFTYDRYGDETSKRWLTMLPWGRIAAYLPYLGWEIVKANIHVLKLVLGTLDRLEPTMVRFDPGLHGEVGRVLLANSITLTPGTVTVDIEPDGHFLVHALDNPSAAGVLEGTMRRKVAHTVKDSGAGAEETTRR